MACRVTAGAIGLIDRRFDREELVAPLNAKPLSAIRAGASAPDKLSMNIRVHKQQADKQQL